MPEPSPPSSLSSPRSPNPEDAIVLDLYKAIPAQVVEDSTTSSLSFDTMSQQSLQSGGATTSDDSDTIKIYNFKKQETTTISREAKEEVAKLALKEETIKTDEKNVEKEQPETAKERPTNLNLNRQESTMPVGTGTTPTRGSTPPAFKFLQPKRKLLDPSQVLSFDEDDGVSNKLCLTYNIYELYASSYIYL